MNTEYEMSRGLITGIIASLIFGFLYLQWNLSIAFMVIFFICYVSVLNFSKKNAAEKELTLLKSRLNNSSLELELATITQILDELRRRQGLRYIFIMPSMQGHESFVHTDISKILPHEAIAILSLAKDGIEKNVDDK